jgi:prevent-host-death family protein
MDEIRIDDLRDRLGKVLERVERGETLTVTRAGLPVGRSGRLRVQGSLG